MFSFIFSAEISQTLTALYLEQLFIVLYIYVVPCRLTLVYNAFVSYLLYPFANNYVYLYLYVLHLSTRRAYTNFVPCSWQTSQYYIIYITILTMQLAYSSDLIIIKLLLHALCYIIILMHRLVTMVYQLHIYMGFVCEI